MTVENIASYISSISLGTSDSAQANAGPTTQLIAS